MGDIIIDAFKGLFKNKADVKLKTVESFGEVLHTSANFAVPPVVKNIKLYNYYLSDPNVQNSVNTFADQLVGAGYYMDGDDPEIIKKLDVWFKQIKFKRKFKTFVKDACITGNGMFEKLIQGKKLVDLDLVDMRIVTGILPDKTDPKIAASVIQTNGGETSEIPYENIIHYKLFEISRQFFGIGLFHSLSVPQYERDGENHSLLDDMKRMREAFARILQRYGSPKSVFTFPNENDAVVKQRAQELKSMKDGEILVVNQDFGYKELTIDPRSRFDKYIDFIQLMNELGTQTPTSKLMTTAGFTEASARAALDIMEGRVTSIKQDLEDMIEDEIIMPYLLGLGMDEKKIMSANINFHIGQTEIPTFLISDILSAAQIIVENKPLITWVETRELLRRSEWKLLPDEEVVKQTPKENEESVDKNKVRKDKKSAIKNREYVIKYKGKEFNVKAEQ